MSGLFDAFSAAMSPSGKAAEPAPPPPAEPQPTAPAEPPSLALFNQTPREYQRDAVTAAVLHVDACLSAPGGDPKSRRKLWSSPAGSGKGSIQLAVLKALRADGLNAWIVTPSLEIVRGFVERCGLEPSGLSTAKLAAAGEAIYVTTPTRLRNRVVEGARDLPDVVIYDEVHHATTSNEVSGLLLALGPETIWLGYTATAYRGSPRATRELRETWGEPSVILTIPEAVARGYQSLPRFEIVPLIDDDRIRVVNGEFQASSATKVFADRVSAIADLIECRTLNVPTAVTVPTSAAASLLVEELDARGIGARWIHQGTKTATRQLSYEEARRCESVLISVRVLVEGVDLPWLRRLIDARPTYSPVSWVQQIGRAMRPGDVQPEYICVCRNLERHAYLLQGAVPNEIVAEAQQVFEEPSKRMGGRALGLEALRRFKTIKAPLAGKLVAGCYSLYSVNSAGVKTEFFALLSPTSPDTLWASRSVKPPAAGETRRGREAYGRWKRCAAPGDLKGFASSKSTDDISVKMRAWWERAAKRRGLDEFAADSITRREFQVLPVLSDLRLNALNWWK